MLGGRADSLRSLRERWTVGRRMDGARAESPWHGRGFKVERAWCRAAQKAVAVNTAPARPRCSDARAFGDYASATWLRHRRRRNSEVRRAKVDVRCGRIPFLVCAGARLHTIWRVDRAVFWLRSAAKSISHTSMTTFHVGRRRSDRKFLREAGERRILQDFDTFVDFRRNFLSDPSCTMAAVEFEV